MKIWIKSKKNLIGYLFIIAIFFFMLEILSFASLYYLQDRLHTIIFDPNKITKFNTKKLNNYSEPLGWITAKEERDNIGARVSPNIYNSTCIEMFGDSFTFSADVSSEFAWPAQLSKLLNCKVNNFGVEGYGSDQATMLHELTKKTAKISVLNHLSENIIRNVNQFRTLIYPTNSIVLKPRYIISDQNTLDLIPKPDLNKFDLVNSKNLKHKLQNEYFIPGGLSGIKEKLLFPYTLSFLDTIFNHYHLNSKLRSFPKHKKFYDKNHDSNALNVTYKIMEKFVYNSKSKGQLPIITIIPTCRDLEYFQKFGEKPYQPLLTELIDNDILHYDFMDKFSKQENFYNYFGTCSSHPNKDGYLFMAENFKDFLLKLKQD
tara:strand:- start:33 stop:1154 length:1122 start_codon:yes stop_codon:yes gene_type:complete